VDLRNTGISGHSRAFPGFFAAAAPAFPGIRRAKHRHFRAFHAAKHRHFRAFPGFSFVVPANAGTHADAEKVCAALA
jgi:hypothetical protein